MRIIFELFVIIIVYVFEVRQNFVHQIHYGA